MSDYDEDIDEDDFLAAAQNIEEAAKPITPSRIPGRSYAQLDLFGRRTENSQSSQRSLCRSSSRTFDEPPTHHEIDCEAARSWIYPTNLGFRDYQYNITQKALFQNILVAVPTGLGKTFISSCVMLNYYRWFPKAKIIFMAPTKPLVAQQIEACLRVCGIPRSATARLTGQQNKETRADAYETRRVFFATPQTIQNDLKSRLLDRKSVVCLVVDEAHRTSGAYSYGEVVKLIREENKSLRILALTATPGGDMETVQNVVNTLCISKIEIRTEESMDVQRYINRKHINTHVLSLSKEILEYQDLYCKVMRPFFEKVKPLNLYQIYDLSALTPFACMQAKETYRTSSAFNQHAQPIRQMYLGYLSYLASISYALTLLLQHGIEPFYNYLFAKREDILKKGNKVGKMDSLLLNSPEFKQIMSRIEETKDLPTFQGHPKLPRMTGIVIDHFVRAQDSSTQTRAMIFVTYRDSADVIVKTLNHHRPLCNATVFIGQAAAKKGGGVGMSQKEQLKTIEMFKNGQHNILVATSIGEEGLDIGDVDLIVCYDSSSSPIRMLQRLGRTGRKRDGSIAILLVCGKEEQSWQRASDSYRTMQQKIANGEGLDLCDGDQSPRIIPRDTLPFCRKETVDIPEENLCDIGKSPLKKRRAVPVKKRAKTFHMSDDVETGFVTAGMISQKLTSKRLPPEIELEPEYPLIPESSILGLLTTEQELELDKIYRSGVAENAAMEPFCVDDHMNHIRLPVLTRTANCGLLTHRIADLIRKIHEIDGSITVQYQNELSADDNNISLPVSVINSKANLKTKPSVRPGMFSTAPSEVGKLVMGKRRGLTEVSTNIAKRTLSSFKSARALMKDSISVSGDSDMIEIITDTPPDDDLIESKSTKRKSDEVDMSTSDDEELPSLSQALTSGFSSSKHSDGKLNSAKKQKHVIMNDDGDY
ncbi:ATP-dependent DNA helicase mph1 [Neolecta irregularis DAH-3]|uniref:ATP-dependent DNA helicase n=1 Tax=Neolecta irregularis (strain DAH-3) TaxID=1198029 RepID=A0A1U7LWW5_NEOID|nr:ATP-dependent DNA helicase mph1 [Neolecta irregularis DAH-3]|eukprot:OLL27108.1 ATP-dependent DNA helicase mph1 [Neolecta irregularis DAH-3]